MKHCYYSIFRKDYVYKGLLLYQSLKKWDADFHLYIFYLHDEVKDFYEKLNLNDATLINLSEIARGRNRHNREAPPRQYDPDDPKTLRETKDLACFYLLKSFPEIEHLVWLDGETFFCADPGSLAKKPGSAAADDHGAEK